MEERRDKLGRRIPVFDRSAAGKKANKTTKEKHGDSIYRKYGTLGGRVRTRGYFGKLKDEGKTDELRTLSIKGAAETNKAKASKRGERTVEDDSSSNESPNREQK